MLLTALSCRFEALFEAILYPDNGFASNSGSMHPVRMQASLIQFLIFFCFNRWYLYCTITTNSNVALYNFIFFVTYINRE